MERVSGHGFLRSEIVRKGKMESRKVGRQRCIINENIMREFRVFCLKLQVQTVRFALFFFNFYLNFGLIQSRFRLESVGFGRYDIV